MDPITILLSIATLIRNPKLGGGGTKAEYSAGLILHLVELIKGGRATAKALEAWGEEVKAMADAGTQPNQRDFDRWTSRLDAALEILAEAEAALEQEPSPPIDPPKDPPADSDPPKDPPVDPPVDPAQ